MRRKRREVLLDRLVITDVGEDGIENRKFRRLGEYRNSRLRHQHHQSDRLERYGFSSRIWPTDDELTIVLLKVERHRDYSLIAQSEIVVQYGMARLHNPDGKNGRGARIHALHIWPHTFVVV